jgi:hypothetical protein
MVPAFGLVKAARCMSRIEFTVRFAIATPALDTTIMGTKESRPLRDNVAAAKKGPLPADLVAEAKRPQLTFRCGRIQKLWLPLPNLPAAPVVDSGLTVSPRRNRSIRATNSVNPFLNPGVVI